LAATGCKAVTRHASFCDSHHIAANGCDVAFEMEAMPAHRRVAEDPRNSDTDAAMTRNLDLVGAMPFPADKLADALASIDEAVNLLQAVSKAPPLPPARLTTADRLMAETIVD
jgi:hypothetical protein